MVSLNTHLPQEQESARRLRWLIACCGGSGLGSGTHVKSLISPDDPVAFIGVDVLPFPPVVNTGGRSTQLTPGAEYIRIGEGLDIARVRALLAEHPEQRPLMAALMRKLPPGPAAHSIETGTEAQRLLALIALLWSRREVETAVERALLSLNDIRLTNRVGAPVHDAAIGVIVIASVAGGVGSALLLPMAGLIRSAMDRLGLPVHRSLFTGVLILADAFTSTQLRAANSFETLRDLETAQRKGVVPWTA